MLVLDRDTFSDLAKNLRSGLAAVGVPLGYSAAYGAAAATLGFRNANSLTAIIRSRPIILGRPDVPGCPAMREVLDSPRAGMENFLRLFRHELAVSRSVPGGDKPMGLGHAPASATVSRVSALVSAALRATGAMISTPEGAFPLVVPDPVAFATIPADGWSGEHRAFLLTTGSAGSGEPDSELCLPAMGTRLRDHLGVARDSPASDPAACEATWLAALRGAVSRLRTNPDDLSLLAMFDSGGEWAAPRWDGMSAGDEKKMRYGAELHEGNGLPCRYSTSPLASLGISVLAGIVNQAAPSPRLAILDGEGIPQPINDTMVSSRGRLWLKGFYNDAGSPAFPGGSRVQGIPVEVVRSSCDKEEVCLALYLTFLDRGGAFGRPLDEVLDRHDGAKVISGISRVLQRHDSAHRGMDEFGGRDHFDEKRWFHISSRDILRDLVAPLSPVGRDGLDWKLVVFEGDRYTRLDLAPRNFDVVRSLADQGIEATVDTDPFSEPSRARTRGQMDEQWESTHVPAAP